MKKLGKNGQWDSLDGCARIALCCPESQPAAADRRVLPRNDLHCRRSPCAAMGRLMPR